MSRSARFPTAESYGRVSKAPQCHAHAAAPLRQHLPAPSTRFSPFIRPHLRSEKFRPGAENCAGRRRGGLARAAGPPRANRPRPRSDGAAAATGAREEGPEGARESRRPARQPRERRAGPGPLPAGGRSPQRRHETGSWVNGLCK